MSEFISAYFSNFVAMIGVYFFGRIILNDKIKLNNRKNLFIFELICILQTLTFLTFDGTIKTLIMLINNVIIYKYIFKLSKCI